MPPKPAIKPRKKVSCHCDECNGKLVDPRTKVKHEAEYEQMNRSSRSTKISKSVSKRVQIDNNDDETSNASSSSSEKFKAVESAVNDVLIDELDNEDTGFNSPIDDDQSEDLNNETSDDERFAAPELEDFGDDEDFMCADSDVEFSESWILIWIFKYQSRFRHSKVSISSLIGFFSQVLKDADPKRFANFPSSSYSAKKLLRINKETKTYAVCPKCNNLYKIGEILGQNEQVTEASPGLKCSQVEFPKHLMKKYREVCGEELLKNVPVNNGYIKRPRIVFPMPDLKTQIFTMYQRPNFEQNLAKWANRHVNGDILADIYDGEVWKTFKSDDTLFFTSELADSNLRIMINLDWFQPFDRTIYSTANNGNFGNFDDMTDWFKLRDLEDFRQNAIAWRNCKTKDERNQHVSNNLVRWTELLRLPYFNPIRHCVVDPMHNLFLRIASWIVKRLWIDRGKISKDDLKIMEKRAETIKLPADMGRIPNKILTGEGFSGFTADQWKTFILVYSTPIIINDLISIQLGNQKLVNGLKLIEPQQTTGSLAAYDDLGSEELVQFKRIFCSELEDTITGSEIYPGNLLSPIKNRVDLPNNLYEQLITYYNEVYGEKIDVEFSSMSNLISRGLQNDSYVVVQPIINQCGRIRVAAEIFGSALASRYKKNSYILAKFTQNNESIELYPGIVQFYFEHVLRLPTIGERTHKLAYVKWYLPVNDY
ncbi:hypothetical protein GLOIN_2v1776801 [Rhizophagus irregularis DAOM 181602=DAOM 197198]|nr:hypothetical protein GLOIN_2v1776801 [Rhizophagus irregularis DAOM 181602=DAOM 197198]